MTGQKTTVARWAPLCRDQMLCEPAPPVFDMRDSQWISGGGLSGPNLAVSLRCTEVHFSAVLISPGLFSCVCCLNVSGEMASPVSL